MFRAIYSEDDDNTIRDKVVSLFEQIFGKNVQTGDDGDKYFVVNGIRSKCLVQINVQNDNVFLDVIDFSLYEKAEEQEKARKRQNYSSEMDAL